MSFRKNRQVDVVRRAFVPGYNRSNVAAQKGGLSTGPSREHTKLLFLYRGAKMFTALGRGNVRVATERNVEETENERSLARVPAGNTRGSEEISHISRVRVSFARSTPSFSYSVK